MSKIDKDDSKVVRVHDGLFKWLISSFSDNFFARFFKVRTSSPAVFLDKEFISKYPALKDSIQADLFIAMDLVIDEKPRKTIVVIEHKSRREEVVRQLYDYTCYAWLLWHEPVWGIAFFTDDAVWRKPTIEDKLLVGYTHSEGDRYFKYDMIKLNGEESADLIAEGNLFCCLLALKANNKGVDRGEIIRQIFRAAARMGDRLTLEHKLLIQQYIKAYADLPDELIETIQKETTMPAIASTITEHFINIGEERGEKRGLKRGLKRGEKRGEKRGLDRGEKRGQVVGAINTLDNLLKDGLISEDVYRSKLKPLQQSMAELEQEDQSKP